MAFLKFRTALALVIVTSMGASHGMAQETLKTTKEATEAQNTLPTLSKNNDLKDAFKPEFKKELKLNRRGGMNSGGGHDSEAAVAEIMDRYLICMRELKSLPFDLNAFIQFRKDVVLTAKESLDPIRKGEEVPTLFASINSEGKPAIDIFASKWSGVTDSHRRDILVMHEVGRHMQVEGDDENHSFSSPLVKVCSTPEWVIKGPKLFREQFARNLEVYKKLYVATRGSKKNLEDRYAFDQPTKNILLIDGFSANHAYVLDEQGLTYRHIDIEAKNAGVTKEAQTIPPGLYYGLNAALKERFEGAVEHLKYVWNHNLAIEKTRHKWYRESGGQQHLDGAKAAQMTRVQIQREIYNVIAAIMRAEAAEWNPYLQQLKDLQKEFSATPSPFAND